MPQKQTNTTQCTRYLRSVLLIEGCGQGVRLKEMLRRIKCIRRTQPMWSGSTGERVTKVEGSFLWPGHGRTCRIVLSKGGRQYFKLQEESEQRLGEKKRQGWPVQLFQPKGGRTSPGPWQKEHHAGGRMTLRR